MTFVSERNDILQALFSKQDTDQNLILLNPRILPDDFKTLQQVAIEAQEARQLRGHVWIATSGSTASSIGFTKLVALSKQSLQSSATAVNAFLKAGPGDTWAQVLPYFHVGGLGIEIRAHISRSKVVSALNNGKWDVHYFYRELMNNHCTLTALVPAQVFDLVANNLLAPLSMRAVVVGGGFFDSKLYQRARVLGWPVLPSYGMTETASQIATASLESLQNKNYEMPDMEILPHAKVRCTSESYLQIEAQSLLTCYAQHTPEGLRHWDPKNEGWFTSEDRGEVLDKKSKNDDQAISAIKVLKIFGRGGDYIKIGGEASNISRLRTVLEQIAFELDPYRPLKVTLIDMPSERLGTEIHMVTTLQSTEAQLLAEAFDKKVMPFEKIRQVHTVDEIPRTDLGKIQWNTLRSKLC